MCDISKVEVLVQDTSAVLKEKQAALMDDNFQEIEDLQKLIESKEDPPANSGSYSLDEHFNVDIKESTPSKSSIV